ncbi:phosphatidylserine decarboxylase [Chungangia koreensis]|uniref:phosphatidylserine decarboxylase n=1 Tax=Chungangia koreensis TaxID=752657 RepID=A0ABV8XA86_9LACT
MKEKTYQLLIELTNGKWSSMLLKKFSSSGISRYLIPSYIKVYGIDMEEVSTERPFSSLHDFFIRELSDNARPIDREYNTIVSPVDGFLETTGEIEKGEKFFVKGKEYSVSSLMGSLEAAQRYKGGTFLVLYLSPANYHWIHSPVNATVDRQYILGNKSYPVNRTGLTYGKSPISGNYRLINELTMENGRKCAVIKVGAMFVNSIHMTHTEQVWGKGESIGYFSFGSTVVLLFEKGSFKLDGIRSGEPVKMGERIGFMV